MNIIGIDVSQGESHATLITKEAEEIAFKFKHNKSGFQILNSYIKPGTIIIFETTGVYSAQLTTYLKNKKVKFYELNPLEAKLRMASLRRNKTDKNDSFKLALLGKTQLAEIKNHCNKQSNSLYESLLRSSLELTFPELNQIFKNAYAVLALQVFRMYCHPDFLVGLTLKEMTTRVYQSVSRRIHKDVIQSYCAQVWLAAKDSYPAVPANSLEIEIISEYCDEIESYNKEIAYIQNKLIKTAVGLDDFKVISSIPGAGQLNSALLLGFTGDIARFDNYKQLNAFLGLDLNRYQSGKYIKGDTINRRGSSQGRAVETDMIRSMLRNQGKIQNHLIDYYYKLKKPPFNKHDKVALIACANHLNRTIINLVHTHQLYNYSKAIN